MAIGQVFLNKYRVDEILGHGGMGVVAKCMHLALNERVAIKMLRRDVLLDRDAVERFQREARAAVKLRSEYVARVLDVGTFENGVPYMVMEFLDGHDLGELIDERGALPAPWATELMLQACEALAEAHSIGIVHRDVKPTNLFVTWRPDGSALIKVLDFGISKGLPLDTDMQLTQTQSLLGTPAYMSPEQMRSARAVDARSDIWSLGTVMYELLEGRRPFEAESFSEMCVKVAVDAPSPMTNAPPALQHVVLRCLAKQPEQRYPTMAELGRDLVPFSQDPHGAAMLVERMSRMLGRRSGADWDSIRTPLPIPPPAAAPASEPWQSDPGALALPNTPAHAALIPREASGPARPPSELTLHRPRGRRTTILAFGIPLALAAATAIAVVASRTDSPPSRAAAGEPSTPSPSHPAGTSPDIASSDKPASDKPDTTATSSDTPASNNAGPDRSASDNTASDKSASDNAGPDKSASDKAASDKAASNSAGPDKSASDNIASDKAASDPDKSGPDKTAAGTAVSGKSGADATAANRTSAVVSGRTAAQKADKARADKARGSTVKKKPADKDSAATKGTEVKQPEPPPCNPYQHPHGCPRP